MTDDTIARKVNSSDASAFAQVCGCCPSQGLYKLSLFRTCADHNDFLFCHSMGCALAHDCSYLLCSWTPSWSGRIQTIGRAAKGGCKTFPARPALVRCYIDGQYTEYVGDGGVGPGIHVVRSVRISAFLYMQYKSFEDLSFEAVNIYLYSDTLESNPSMYINILIPVPGLVM
jgi:hypothetical protein